MPAKLSDNPSSSEDYSKPRFGKKEKVLTMIIGVFLIFLIFFFVIYYKGTVFYRQGEKESIALAKKYGDVTKPLDFYYFNREMTYFSVKGENSQKEIVYVLIPENSEKVQVLKEKDGISYDEALEIGLKQDNVKQIDKLGLGKIDDEVVWELTGHNNGNQLVYYYLNFKNGGLRQKIENL